MTAGCWAGNINSHAGFNTQSLAAGLSTKMSGRATSQISLDLSRSRSKIPLRVYNDALGCLLNRFDAAIPHISRQVENADSAHWRTAHEPNGVLEFERVSTTDAIRVHSSD